MNYKQQTFITEYLRHRSAFTAYCLAYNLKDCSNYDSIMSSANRLLNHPEVNSVITSVLEGIRQEVEQEIRAEMKTEMLTIQSKRELLARIATGETYAVQNYKGKDCNMCVQHVWPTINQMLKAIDLDNKMVGLYTSLRAPEKPNALAATDAQIMQQVDKFIQTIGITIDNQENSSLEQGSNTPAPEKSDEMATTALPPMRPINNIMNELKDNKFLNELQSGKSTNSKYSDENGNKTQQFMTSNLSTKLVSPLGG